MRKTKRLATISLLTAFALIVFIIEAQLPPIVPMPGVKLGLANVVTLAAMMILNRRDAGVVLLLRVLLGSIFAGSPSTILFSAAGGLLAYLVMCLMTGVLKGEYLWLTSAFAGIAHNIGQLIMCVITLKTPQMVLYYGPWLLIAGTATGVFNGLVAGYLIKALNSLKK